MRPKLLAQLGVPCGECQKIAIECVRHASEDGMSKKGMKASIKSVVRHPAGHLQDPYFGPLASKMVESAADIKPKQPLPEPVPHRIWGEDIEQGALDQLHNACILPVSVRAALMPDAHLGYGLPIGGVLATKGAVIPYAVGVDIACRMKMSVLDMPVSALETCEDRLKSALTRETAFGPGVAFKTPKKHDVMDDDWSVSLVTRKNRDNAWKQLGSSGGGNHFAEFGILTLAAPDLGLDAGRYLALLSHSGSRHTGLEVANYYSKLARQMHPDLPRELQHLAWLDLNSQEGIEYWAAMELMGKYAAANHMLIHRAIAKNLGVEVLADIENHHNFAWKETHFGEDVIVHRKGATPATVGVLGIIPGSMATPGYIVRGKGHPESLFSCAHGAGRKMSRKEAFRRFDWNQTQAFLEKHGVKLISASLDESPMAYKDIDAVMAYQSDLVEMVARFDPKLVKMAPK